ncbi:hypothetical protein LTR37_001417 [Vermiconidia calcicola]|uniref:Uncharacterized protein n=1 Tax=Vermiconidia calcicola TaxID=1690605 RepID=A0ACC3NXF2_9PEZI|nr:hypothetical protein LTR37_001417 [Vermiconidia calcicola]
MKRKSMLPHYEVAAKAPKNTNASRQQKLHLLGLPAELRNKIYEYALVDFEDTQIWDSCNIQPPLLHVCRTIRREAISIFYTFNLFNLHIRDCDSKPVHHFYTTQQKYFRGPGIVREGRHSGIGWTILYGTPNWANLRGWCKAWYEGGMGLVAGEKTPSGCRNRNAAMGVTTAVYNMGGVEWAVVDQVLMGMRQNSGGGG